MPHKSPLSGKVRYELWHSKYKNGANYKLRDLKDLEANALKFWPERISEIERNASIIPKLIETQDKFISLLNIANAEPFAWKIVLATTKELSANLFLKHLMVLSDIGGEKLMRFKKALPTALPDSTMEGAQE